MTTKNVSRVVKVFSAVLLFAGIGSAQAITSDLGTVSDGSYGFGRSLNFGETFTDYVNFNLDTSADVTSFIKSFDMSIFGFDLVGIDNFHTGLQKLGNGGGYTSIASFTSNPSSFDDLLSHEQEVQQLKAAMAELKEQERTVLALYYFEELKLHEIAKVLELTESRVSQIRSKAIGRLRTQMAPLRSGVRVA